LPTSLVLKVLPQYCERSGIGLFSEPLNTASNAFFFIAAWISWRTSRHLGGIHARILPLIGLTVAVGIGSTLWHMFATPWAHLFDVVPILLFQIYFLWLYCRQTVGMTWQATILLQLLYVGVSFWGSKHQEWLNGVLLYNSTIVLLLIVGCDHYFRSKREPFLLLLAAGIFCVSLFFRTIDMAVCHFCPTGTHFLWHFLNSILMLLAMRKFAINHQ
jgi:hypothetical protein